MSDLNININTGEKRVTINNDPARVIIFNPTDVIFAERFYILLGEMKDKLLEFNRRGQELGSNKATDGDGMPVNMAEQIVLQVQASGYLREKIDSLFGNGASQAAFGDVHNLDVIVQFFNGILPFFETTRAEKVAMYTSPASAKRNRRKK